MSKTRASCFIRGAKHLETIKALGLRPRAFICFLVFGTPDETLALVFDILPKNVQHQCSWGTFYDHNSSCLCISSLVVISSVSAI